MKYSDRCSRCDHPRSFHTDRLAPGLLPGCPLPCECVGFELATPATVYTRPTGGRAEAGWLAAGRIVGKGPEILRDGPEAAVGYWGDLTDP